MLQSGELKEEAITRAAGHVLYEMDKFGYLDHPPSHKIQPHATDANARIIQQTAEDAAVLLKNEGNILPLKPSDLASLAMIGPGAGQTVAIGIAGERSLGFAVETNRTVSCPAAARPERENYLCRRRRYDWIAHSRRRLIA